MRALLLAALLAPPAALARDQGAIPANWNELDVPLAEEEIAGLRELGFRLEPDGRVLDLELKVLDADGIAQARRLLHAGDRRRKLERLRAFLATQPQDAPLSPEARREALRLADGRLFAAVGRGELTAGALSRMARLDLNAVARVFDGNAAKGAAAVAVAAPETAPSNRPRFPYLTRAEQQAGDAMRAAAVARLSNYERGRLILSRLHGRDGQPDLPPILVESIGTPAQYDPVRRAVIIDREAAVTELIAGMPPSERAERRRELQRPDVLAQALAANTLVAGRLMARNDVLVAHELTHAWQDRRDSVWRRMRKGHIPQAVPFEYEEEANLEKNLYIHDVLRGTPGAVIEPQELQDYRLMMMSYRRWREALQNTYQGDPNSVVRDIGQIEGALRARRDAAQNFPVRNQQERREQARLVRNIQRGQQALSDLRIAHMERMREVKSGPVAAAEREHNTVMARHFLEVASMAPNDVARGVALDSARSYAEASADAELIERVQSELRQRR